MKPFFLIFTLLCQSLLAQGPLDNIGFDPFAEQASNTASKSSLISEVSEFVPGQPFKVALKLEHAEGWHSYYKNPGFAGLPPTLKWTLPEGWSAGPIEYQVPHTVLMAGEMTYGYEGTAYFFTTLTPPEGAKEGQEFEIELQANWQICEDSCVFEPGPGIGDFKKFTIDLSAAKATKASDQAAELSEAQKHLPKTPEDWEVSYLNTGSSFIIELKPKGEKNHSLEELYFFSEKPGIVAFNEEQKLEKKNGVYRLKIQKEEGSEPFKTLSGIISAKGGFRADGSVHGLLLEGIKPGVATADDLYEDVEIGAFLLIIGGMMLGGVILNLMPCVFPVIGLKIMGFVNQAGDDRKKIAAHGIVFTAGVLLSFWLLSGFLLFLREQALRGDGGEVGWGYQLQNPWMVWGLLLIMFILGLNMFGLFEIGAKATSVGGKLQAKHGLSGSFFSGVLATVVATPCSAPFLGAAIGAAFALPPIKFMIAFTAMAVGLALPYIMLSLFPSLVNKLPRPGAWMESFKQGMSFLLFGTAGYLAWVYLAQVDSFHGLYVFIGLASIAAGTWVYGRWTELTRSKAQRLNGTIVASILVLAGLYLSRPVIEVKIPWEPWSEEAVAEALEEGRPVYVDYTAKWCVTCQVNKKRAYTEEVAQLFADRNILMLRADKTSASPKIEASLQKLGRTAIPVNVLHVPGKDEPIITPEILSADYLKNLIESETEIPNSKE